MRFSLLALSLTLTVLAGGSDADDPKGSPLTGEQVADELGEIRARLRTNTATVEALGRQRDRVVRDAESLVLLAEFASRDEKLGLHRSAASLHGIGTRLREAATSRDGDVHTRVQAEVESLGRFLEMPPKDPEDATVERSSLSFAMRRFNGSLTRLRAAADDPQQLARERVSLARDAAIAAALTRLVRGHRDPNQEPEFADHAMDLGREWGEIGRAIADESEPSRIRVRLDAATNRCIACHRDYR